MVSPLFAHALAAHMARRGRPNGYQKAAPDGRIGFWPSAIARCHLWAATPTFIHQAFIGGLRPVRTAPTSSRGSVSAKMSHKIAQLLLDFPAEQSVSGGV